MDESRLGALAAKLSAMLDELRGLHDRYDALDEESYEAKRVNAEVKVSRLRDLIATYERHLMMMRFMLGEDVDMPLSEWVRRELAGETLVYDAATRALVPLADNEPNPAADSLRTAGRSTGS